MQTTDERPAATAGESYRQTDVTPDEFFRAWSRAEREALIEVLIDTLDLESDCDEDSAVDDDGCDEAELERSFAGITADDAGLPGYNCEDELEADDRGGEADSEWSLGSVATSETTSQEHWSAGLESDREEEHDGREPENEHGDDSDYEPSLGWSESVCQSVPNTSYELCDCEQGAGPLHRGIRYPGAGGVSVDTSCGYATKITGLTAQQAQALGTDWLRR